MQVKFLDLRSGYLELKNDIDAAIERVLDSGIYILGNEVEHFESEFAAYCQAEYCVSVSNGLSAIELALKAIGVVPGDEVIVPSNTFIATWFAVSNIGAIPVPVEPGANSFNLDPDLVSAAITAKTKAIIAVHLYGCPADLDELKNIAKKHGLVLLEDAAQAHGAEYKGM